jgi:hypothetical protein
MAAITGTRRGEDPRRADSTLQGPRPEDADQGGPIRVRSRNFVNNSGYPASVILRPHGVPPP